MIESNYEWSYNQAVISQQLCLATYCGHLEYPSYNFMKQKKEINDKIIGFQITKTIYDSKHDTNGFIGFIHSDESIYVAFRGSSSIKNWITDLNMDKDPYLMWPECNC